MPCLASPRARFHGAQSVAKEGSSSASDDLLSAAERRGGRQRVLGRPPARFDPIGHAGHACRLTGPRTLARPPLAAWALPHTPPLLILVGFASTRLLNSLHHPILPILSPLKLGALPLRGLSHPRPRSPGGDEVEVLESGSSLPTTSAPSVSSRDSNQSSPSRLRALVTGRLRSKASGDIEVSGGFLISSFPSLRPERGGAWWDLVWLSAGVGVPRGGAGPGPAGQVAARFAHRTEASRRSSHSLGGRARSVLPAGASCGRAQAGW